MKISLPNPKMPLKIGTRGSPLAMAQAIETRLRLMQAYGLPEDAFTIVPIKTSGDLMQSQKLSAFGGKGLFTKEIEEALADGRIDIAVHSMKDVPTLQPDGLEIRCVLPREDVRDAFVSLTCNGLGELPVGAVLGTSSLRRKAQLLSRRPDLTVVEFRGNVQTRLRKLESGLADATLLAMAGIQRLRLVGVPYEPIDADGMLPAIAQGAIGIETRVADHATKDLLSAVNHTETMLRVATERAFLRELDGSCQTPIAGLAELSDGTLRFRGELILPDGSECHQHGMSGPIDDAADIGIETARVLRQRAGPKFFEQLLSQ
jgi:hydroxymethylbilane synthase